MFLNTLNKHQQCIKLTSETSYDSVNFLDTTIFKGDRFRNTGRLDSKVFFKPTDTHQLLHKESFHPKHTFSGILKSQILRFHRICNNTNDFESATTVLLDSLRRRNYSARFLRHIKNSILHNIENENRIETATACHGLKCRTCAHFIDFTPIQGTHDATEANNNNCSTENVVYLISCSICPVKYVGETGNTLRTRVNQHRTDIQHHDDTPVAHQFNLADHYLTNLRITILQAGPFSVNAVLEGIYRRNVESCWMNKLKTTQHNGLNIRDSTSNIIPFVIPLSGEAGTVAQLARNTYKQLQLEFPRIFTPRFITAYSRNKNLEEMLVSTTFR